MLYIAPVQLRLLYFPSSSFTLHSGGIIVIITGSQQYRNMRTQKKIRSINNAATANIRQTETHTRTSTVLKIDSMMWLRSMCLYELYALLLQFYTYFFFFLPQFASVFLVFFSVAVKIRKAKELFGPYTFYYSFRKEEKNK
jgi:hypothetical protein